MTRDTAPHASSFLEAGGGALSFCFVVRIRGFRGLFRAMGSCVRWMLRFCVVLRRRALRFFAVCALACFAVCARLVPQFCVVCRMRALLRALASGVCGGFAYLLQLARVLFFRARKTLRLWEFLPKCLLLTPPPPACSAEVK